MKLVPLADTETLQAAGIPYSKTYLYKLHCLGFFPSIFIKIRGRLLIDVEEFQRLAEECRGLSLRESL